MYITNNSAVGLIAKISDMLNKNSLGLLKKGAAKQSRIKSIVWHLRWPVRTRADISLCPSGLVRSRTDIKLRPSELVRSRTDSYQVAAKCIRKNNDQFQVADSSICKIIQGLIQEQVYTQIFLNCHLAAF